jgi:hypothetical protein
MPRVAELYRAQIDLGLSGNLAAAAKVRTIPAGEIMLSPAEDGAHCGPIIRCSRQHCCKAQERLVGVTRYDPSLAFRIWSP